MKIGVMSDTHGHLNIMRQVANQMIDKYGVDTIIHLGDDSTDADELSSLAVDLYSVPGIFEPRYKDKSVPNRVIKELEDVPFLLTHTPTRESADLEGDLDPTEAIDDGDVKVVLYGHSHAWRVGEEKGVIVINPGHLADKSSKASKGQDPSFAVLDLTSRKMDVKIYSLENKLLQEKTFFFEA